MKKEHFITGLVVIGIFIVIMNNNKNVLDGTVVDSKSNDAFSFDGIDDSMADMSVKNVFKSKARLKL